MQKIGFNTVKIVEVKQDLGQLVRTLRKGAKLSQQELADLLSLSRLTIQNLELGKNCTIETLLKVLQYFDLLPELKNAIDKYGEEQKEVKSLY